MNTDIIQIALSEYGLKEVAGDGNNPEILQMAKDCNFTGYTADSIAWCSLFANWCALKAGYERSKSLAARSWLNVGAYVNEPEIGDVVVLWRDDPHGGLGHVGFYINKTPTQIYLLAGNQGDQVCIEAFPMVRVLGYRRLSKV